MSIYTLEFLDDDDRLTILRYNTDTKEHDYRVRRMDTPLTSGYELPDENTIYFCLEVSHNKMGSISQRLGSFESSHLSQDETTQTKIDHAHEMIYELENNEQVSHFMEHMISQIGSHGIKLDGTPETGSAQDFSACFRGERSH